MRFLGAAALAVECAVIGLSGVVVLYETVQAVSCGQARRSDYLMGGIGAFLIGIAVWEYRHS